MVHNPQQQSKFQSVKKKGLFLSKQPKMHFRISSVFFFLFISSFLRGNAEKEIYNEYSKPSSPFSDALEILQKQMGYNFQRVGLLRRAMTHPSYSGENNRALSIMGSNAIQASVSLRSLGQDIEISSKDLNSRVMEITGVDSCFEDGLQLGLQKVVRVSFKTNSSTPAVVCGAFRAIFGAIAVDTGKVDSSGNLFWSVHGGDFGALGL